MKNKIHVLLLLLLITKLAFSQNRAIDSLKRVLKVSKIDTSRVAIYNNIANEFKNINPDSTAYYGTKANELALKNDFELGQATAQINIGNSNIMLSNYTKAILNFDKAQKIYTHLLDFDSNNKTLKTGLARSFASAGVVFSELNNYTKALENYQKALKIYLAIDDTKSISKTYNNIAVVYKSQKNNLKALEYLLKALKIQEAIGEQTAANTLINIGNIQFDNDNKPLALYYYQKAEKLFLTTDDQRGKALLNNYLGDYYHSNKENKIANDYYSKSLKLYDEMGNTFGASLVLFNIGICCSLKFRQ